MCRSVFPPNKHSSQVIPYPLRDVPERPPFEMHSTQERDNGSPPFHQRLRQQRRLVCDTHLMQLPRRRLRQVLGKTTDHCPNVVDAADLRLAALDDLVLLVAHAVHLLRLVVHNQHWFAINQARLAKLYLIQIQDCGVLADAWHNSEKSVPCINICAYSARALTFQTFCRF